MASYFLELMSDSMIFDSGMRLDQERSWSCLVWSERRKAEEVGSVRTGNIKKDLNMLIFVRFRLD